ncbi:hypothetical protein DYB32_003267 [Aphanomyces invadans]|uniref:GPI-anchor transamidase n=1 Tax=Aphanomyces invadans TaxID=157072 RepID=A0A3R6W2U9_9STRA|nr:hypothetical protein DYB32_003267 [Aphanomyces invadans]
MLADQMPCNARNCFPGKVFDSNTHATNLYGDDVEVDYRGAEVTVANFIKVLTGRHEPGTPASRRLDSDEDSNIFMTGHGGDGFLKFQDAEELSSHDIAQAVQEMHVKGRYNELFYMVDTCQAGSLATQLYSPNVVTIGSARTGENSYAYHTDFEVGLSLIDRFTYATLDYMQSMQVNRENTKTLGQLFGSYDPHMLYSTPDARTELLGRSINDVPITDFLGSVLQIHVTKDEYPVVADSPPATSYSHLYQLEKPRSDGPLPRQESAPVAKADPVELAALVAGFGVALLALSTVPFTHTI